MMLQEQLGRPQQPHVPVDFTPLQIHVNAGLLGNKFSQAPATLAGTDSLVDVYSRLPSGSHIAFKLTLLKQLKFTPESREKRIAASLAALNAAQPTELSLAQWKEIVEEVEEDED